jgi:hypothetical protein
VVEDAAAGAGGAGSERGVVIHAFEVGVEAELPPEQLTVELLHLLGLVAADLEPGHRTDCRIVHDCLSLTARGGVVTNHPTSIRREVDGSSV